MNDVYLYGASGHAKVIIDILESRGIKPAGLFDDNPSIKKLMEYPVSPFSSAFNTDENKLIISIGNNSVRKKIVCSLKVNYCTVIHPSANVSKRTIIEEGTVIMAGVTINAAVSIGKHCIINTNASIDHDSVLGDFVHISPNVALCGDVEIGEGTHIGAGAVIIPGIKIGKWCTIGAGAVVIRDVADHTTVVGNPCRIIKINSTQ